MKRYVVFAAVIIVAGCSTTPVREPPAPLVEFSPTVKVERLWSADVGARIDSGVKLVPKIVKDSLYAADGKGRVKAYRVADGRELWSASLGTAVSGAVGAGDGLVFVATREGEVIALEQTSGKPLWRAALSSEALAPPVVSSGIVIVQTVDGKLMALAAADGKRLWVSERTEPALSLRGTDTPVIYDGTVIAGFANGRVAALNLRDGRVLWEVTVAQPRGRNEIERLVDVDASPLVLPDAIYAASYQGKLVALNPRTGTVGWTRDVSTYTGLAADDANVYVTNEHGHVLAFDRRNGAGVWRQEALRGRRLNAPVVYRDYVIVADYEGYVHWLARDDGRFAGRYRVGSAPIRAPVLPVADTLVVLGHAGELAALRSSSK